MIGPNPYIPQELAPTDRIAEVAEILAAGLMRLRARKSSRIFGEGGESSVDFMPHQSGHANGFSRETDA
jgi:hypothetical protein